MEFGTIEREIFIEASPEVVFDVVSGPDHLQQWWPDEACYVPVPGSAGEIVTFDLTPSGGGTLLKMTETGFREMGWEVAVLEQQYHEHVTGGNYYLPRLAPYVSTMGRGGERGRPRPGRPGPCDHGGP